MHPALAPYVRSFVAYDVAGEPTASRGGSVADPEGNHWSFGSYQPHG
jgi:uncharacterized glyoxalase superfamily protein PhnB